MENSKKKIKNFNFSLLAAACLFINVGSYGARTYNYQSRKHSHKGRHGDSFNVHPNSHKAKKKIKKTKEVFLPEASIELSKKSITIAPIFKTTPSYSSLPYLPRLLAEGTAASQGFIYGDALIPLLGNSESFLFIDSMGKGGTDKGWLANTGIGLREIWKGAIFGGYVFGEYDRTALGNNYWTISPGLEILTPRWDLHANAYFPLGNKDNFNFSMLAPELGPSCPTFIGHKQFESIFFNVNEVAPGLDAEVGFVIPKTHRARIFGGGYYYFFNHAPNLQGLMGGVEIPLHQRISLLFRDSYDNINKNTAVFTVRVYFGGQTKTDERDIHERLLDPIERDIGVLYTGSGIPTQQVLFNTGEMQLVRDNVWFFKPGGTFYSSITKESCTFENPCSSDQFNQTSVNTISNIATSADFYLAEGANYPMGPLTLRYSQSIYGRNSTFCDLGLPVLLGNLNLEGNHVLQSFRLLNRLVPANISTAGTGITAANASNIFIDRVFVGPTLPMQPFAEISSESFVTGINLNNAKNVVITGSEINAAERRVNAQAVASAIRAQIGAEFTLTDSKLNIHETVLASTTGIADLSGRQGGIYLNNNRIANLSNNSINMISDALLTDTAYLNTRSRGITQINNGLSQPSILNSRKNQINLTTYLKGLKSGTTSTFPRGLADGIYLKNNAFQSIINSDGDAIRSTITANGLYSNNASTYRHRGISIVNTSGDVKVNLANDSFNMQNSVIALRLTRNRAAAGIYLRADNNSSTTINSLNDNFAINYTNTLVNSGAQLFAFSYRQYGIYIGSSGSGTQVNVNSLGDTFSVNANVNAATAIYDLATSVSGVLIRPTTTSTNARINVNTQGDVFNINTQVTGASVAGSAGYHRGLYIKNYAQPSTAVTINSTRDIFNINTLVISTAKAQVTDVSGVVAFSFNAATSTINVSGDNFNIVARAYGAIPYASAFGAKGLGANSLVNLRNNTVFKFRVRRNGVPGTVTPTLGNVTNDGSTQFIIY